MKLKTATLLAIIGSIFFTAHLVFDVILKTARVDYLILMDEYLDYLLLTMGILGRVFIVTFFIVLYKNQNNK
jgi:hypothetical protein